MCDSENTPAFACDAMCGGLARWLRALGYDATFTEGIDDADLVEHARRDARVLITSDGPLMERRVITSGEVRAYFLPRGLNLLDQVRRVATDFGLTPRDARCTRCNGPLEVVSREGAADAVPARSLLWATQFYRCRICGHAYWNGSHWKRVERVREDIARRTAQRGADPA